MHVHYFQTILSAFFNQKWLKNQSFYYHFVQIYYTEKWKISSRRCHSTLLYRKDKILFGSYFHEKTWSLLCTSLHKVTKPHESFKIEAKYAKVCFLQQGLIPGLQCGNQVSYPLDHESSDKDWARWKKNLF